MTTRVGSGDDRGRVHRAAGPVVARHRLRQPGRALQAVRRSALSADPSGRTAPPRLLEIDPELARPLVAIGWLVGTWQGAGEVTYPSMDQAVPFGQEVVVSHDGRPFLRWDSRTWALGPDGTLGRPLATETGFWRVPSGRADLDGTDVELLLVHPMGYLEQFLGRAHAGKIELATELVARSADAAEYNAATRLYGYVAGDLLWALDMAAVGHPMQSHSSARLRKVP